MAGTFINLPQSETTGLIPSYTTAERNLLSPTEGQLIFNTDDQRFQGYFDSAWADIHGWGS